jgi:hypothetical protein
VSKDVIVPKKPFDKTLAKIGQQLCWEAQPEAVRYVVSVIQDQAASTKDRLAASKLILERTIPVIASVRQVNVNIPAGANTPDVDWADIHRRAVQEVEKSERTNGNGIDSRIH